MTFHTPWIFITVAGVPLFMMYTKIKRMDAKETHEIQMRVKYRAEFWAKGNEFVHNHSNYIWKQLIETADNNIGSDVMLLEKNKQINNNNNNNSEGRSWWCVW